MHNPTKTIAACSRWHHLHIPDKKGNFEFVIKFSVSYSISSSIVASRQKAPTLFYARMKAGYTTRKESETFKVAYKINFNGFFISPDDKIIRNFCLLVACLLKFFLFKRMKLCKLTK